MHRPRNSRPRSAFLSLAVLAALGACRAPAGTSGPVVLQAPKALPQPIDPARAQALRALQATLADGDDERATQLIRSLRAGELTEREVALLDAAEKVIAGRALVRTLELGLASEPVPDHAESYALVLRARTSAPHEVRLRLAPSDLKRLRTTIDPRGVEGFDYESRVSDVLSDLRLAPGGERRVELLTYELPIGRALAARERWRVETRSGEIESEGKVYPAAHVTVASCTRERLSPLLPEDEASATAVAELLEEDEAPTQRALLETAIRVPADTREQALRELTPTVARLARRAPERVVAAEPALRWLSQNRELGPDAAAWARYLEARLSAGEGDDEALQPIDGLDLPAPKREPELGAHR